MDKIGFPALEKEIFKTENGTNTIYEATYENTLCYAIKHNPSGHIELIDHNEKIIGAIISKIKRVGALVCYARAKQDTLRFPQKGRERGVSLRLYVFDKYKANKRDRSKKVMQYDDSLSTYNISDLREQNLYAAGEFRPVKNKLAITIAENQEMKEKAIVVSYSDCGEVTTEIYPYSVELYEILSSSKYCSISGCKDNGRLTASIHHGHTKNDYKPVNLSHFVMVFNTHFENYRKQKGSIKKFIHAFNKLNLAHSSEHAAHVTAKHWCGAKGNLIWMDGNDNICMSDITEHFLEPYNLFATGDNSGGILIDFSVNDRHYYYHCSSSKEYEDFQKILIGKRNLTKNLKISHVTETAIKCIETPKEVYAAHNSKAEKPSIDALIASYWCWCEDRNRLLERYKEAPNDFRAWHCVSGGINLAGIISGSESGRTLSYLIEMLMPRRL